MHFRLLKTKTVVIIVPFEDIANHCNKVIKNNSRLLSITLNKKNILKFKYDCILRKHANYLNPLDHAIRIQSIASLKVSRSLKIAMKHLC